MTTVPRSLAAFEQLSRLLPKLEELEGLRLCMARVAFVDPSKEWDRSSSFATIDKRVITPERTEQVLSEAEADLLAYVGELFARFRPVLEAFWSGDEAGAAERLIATGEWLEQAGWLDKARECFGTALALALPLQRKEPQILALRRIARVSLAAGDLTEASDYYQRSQELARHAGDLKGDVIGGTGYGNVLALQGRWAEAEQVYREALQRIDAGSEPTRLALQRAQLFNNLGMVTMRLRRADEAEAWLRDAHRLWATIESAPDLAICYHNQALLAESQGQLDEARTCFHRALELDIPTALRAPIAIDLAESFLPEGPTSQAKHWGRQAENYAVEARSPYYLGRVYRGLGNIARDTGDEDGFTFYEKALQIARERGYPLLEAETLTDYAGLRIRTGGVEEARAYLERAVAIFLRLGDVGEQRRAAGILEQMEAAALEPTGD